MKHLITRTLTSLMLAAMWLPLAAQAQHATVVKANIPFEFSFNGKTFPAGEYSLAQPVDHVLALRDADGKVVAQAFSQGVNSFSGADSTKLRFQKVDGQNILSEVWQKYESDGARLFPADRPSKVATYRSTEARAAAEGSRP